MSAYMVEDKTINRVISYLVGVRNSNGSQYIIRRIKEFGYDLALRDHQIKMAQDMFDLNIRAIEGRYGDRSAAEFRPLDFEFRIFMPPSPIQAYKSLGCWLYQCCEGSIPEESDLYKMMSQVKDYMAHNIVSNMPAYDKAEWG